MEPFIIARCIFCQQIILPHFHNLVLLVRHCFCEFIRASIWTCAFTWFQTHCDIFLNLLAGEFSLQAAWFMLCCSISVNQQFHHQRQDAYLALIMSEVRKLPALLTEGE